ncbi:MAG: phenylalanine--tRNA ligase subunit beta, partial [Clostridia bacterium]
FTSRAAGMRTDSGKRFEKGLPPYNTCLALNRACELVRLLECGDVVDGEIDILNASIEPARVKFDFKRINEILGTSISHDEMVSILKRIELVADGDEIVVPPYRNDILNTADLSEEVVRLYGLNNIKPTLFECRASEGKLTHYQKFLQDINLTCVGLGFYEIYSYSFISPKMLDKIKVPADDKRRDMIKLKNPLGDETSVMRTTALPSILESLLHNYNHRVPSCKLFECATLYKKSDVDMSSESKSLALAFYGNGDFYDMKGYIEAILKNLGINNYKIQSDSENCSYHPGRCAKIIINDKKVGSFGQIHPAVAHEFGIDTDVYAATISVTKIYANADTDKHYAPLPIFPSIERDLALVMDKDIEAQTIVDAIYRFSGKSLCSVNVFDVYTGAGIPEGKKSVAFRLTYRLPDKTMNDTEAEAATLKLLRRLKEDMNIIIR